MKTIITGTRTFIDYNQFDFLLEELIADKNLQITEVFSGLAAGPDSMGKIWAEERKIPVREFPANWDEFGNSAGPIRNREMLNAGAECLILFFDGKSAGSKNILKQAKEKKLKNIFVFRLDS